MRLTVMIVLLLVCLTMTVSIAEAGKKNKQRRTDKERKQKRNKNKRHSSPSDLGSSSFEEENEASADLESDGQPSVDRECLTKPKKRLRLELAALQSRQNSSAVFIAPTPIGGNHLPPSDQIEERTNGRCRETVYRETNEGQYPPVTRNIVCSCVGCETDGVPTADCHPILYQLDVLQRSESEPCFEGMVQYERAKRVITVGCVYRFFE